MKQIYKCLGIIILLQSCSCDWYLTKAKEKCGSSIVNATITVHDTIKIDKVTKDTVFKQGKDTVIIREGRLTMKYFYNNKDSTVYLNGKCDTIYVIREKTIQVPVTEIKEGFGDWIKRFWWIPVIMLLALGVWRFVKGP
jgi:hypothetical protein